MRCPSNANELQTSGKAAYVQTLHHSLRQEEKARRCWRIGISLDRTCTHAAGASAAQLAVRCVRERGERASAVVADETAVGKHALQIAHQENRCSGRRAVSSNEKLRLTANQRV